MQASNSLSSSQAAGAEAQAWLRDSPEQFACELYLSAVL